VDAVWRMLQRWPLAGEYAQAALEVGSRIQRLKAASGSPEATLVQAMFSAPADAPKSAMRADHVVQAPLQVDTPP
jgi:hypothetical protein